MQSSLSHPEGKDKSPKWVIQSEAKNPNNAATEIAPKSFSRNADPKNSNQPEQIAIRYKTDVKPENHHPARESAQIESFKAKLKACAERSRKESPQ